MFSLFLHVTMWHTVIGLCEMSVKEECLLEAYKNVKNEDQMKVQSIMNNKGEQTAEKLLKILMFGTDSNKNQIQAVKTDCSNYGHWVYSILGNEFCYEIGWVYSILHFFGYGLGNGNPNHLLADKIEQTLTQINAPEITPDVIQNTWKQIDASENALWEPHTWDQCAEPLIESLIELRGILLMCGEVRF